MEHGKGKHMFIKNDVTRNVHTTSRWVKALVTFVMITVPEKHTLLGTKSEFSRVVWSKIGPASASKSAKE
jgi:hypothetical protein